MDDDRTTAGGPAEPAAPIAAAPLTDAENVEPKKPEDLIPHAQTEDTRKKLAEMGTDLKVPADLSKVSNAKAKELVEAGIAEDADLPGKMYKRKADGFVTRIPNYIFDAYTDYHQDEWDEIKLPSDEKK